MPGLEKKTEADRNLAQNSSGKKGMESFVDFSILLGLSAASLSLGWYRMLWNERAL